MDKQKDLEGNETGVTKETVKRLTVKYTADAFTVSVTETGEGQLDKLHEGADIAGIRRWVVRNMKVRDPKLLRSGEEGAVFQSDLEKLVEELLKR